MEGELHLVDGWLTDEPEALALINKVPDVRAKLLESIALFDEVDPRRPGVVLGEYVAPDRKISGRTWLDEAVAARFKREDGTIPVLISYEPGAERHHVIGIRPLDWRPEVGKLSPDGSRCGRHARLAAVGSCARCGTFVCVLCARQRSDGLRCLSCAFELSMKSRVLVHPRLYVALAAAMLAVPFVLVLNWAARYWPLLGRFSLAPAAMLAGAAVILLFDGRRDPKTQNIPTVTGTAWLFLLIDLVIFALISVSGR